MRQSAAGNVRKLSGVQVPKLSHCTVPLSLHFVASLCCCHWTVQAAWVAGEYADIPFSNREHFNLAFHSVVRLLSDPELPVRVDAVVALRSFIEASADDLELLRPLIPQLLNGESVSRS